MLDERDMEILRTLKRDGKSPVNKIARLTGIPPATVHHRLKKLESEKVIQKYTVDLDDSKLGYSLSAYIFITVQATGRGNLDQRMMAEKLAKYELVEEAAVLAGDVDMVLKVHARTMEELNSFVLGRLRNFEGIERTRTLMVMYHSKGD